LPSDLEEGGIGFGTHSSYQTGHQVWKVNYPWKNKLLISQLNKSGWNIHFHNANWFYWTVCNDLFIKKTTSMPIQVEKEEAYRTTKNYNEELLNINSSYYQKEKIFINKIQTRKSDKNEFYFIKNNQYHQAIVSKSDKAKSLDLIIKWYENWDFNERNALFWMFSDHHDFSMIDKLCSPPETLTWAFIKDNAYSLNINKSYIHISDFFNLSSLTKEDDKNRIYFSEDARCHIDKLNSTTAVACKFTNWIGKKANKLLQVSYYKPDNSYHGFLYDLNLKKNTKISPDKILQIALKERFKWII